MIINFNKNTLLKDQPLTPGWYKATVSKIGKPEITGDRVDQPITFAFEAPELKVDDRDVDHTFYNATGKGIGFTVAFAAAILGKTRQELADDLESGEALPFEFEQTLGQTLQIKIINNDFQGRVQNRVDGFLPADMEIPI